MIGRDSHVPRVGMRSTTGISQKDGRNNSKTVIIVVMGNRNSGQSVASSGWCILGVVHVHRIDVDIIIFSWATLGISLWVIDLLWQYLCWISLRNSSVPIDLDHQKYVTASTAAEEHPSSSFPLLIFVSPSILEYFTVITIPPLKDDDKSDSKRKSHPSKAEKEQQTRITRLEEEPLQKSSGPKSLHRQTKGTPSLHSLCSPLTHWVETQLGTTKGCDGAIIDGTIGGSVHPWYRT